MTCKVIEPGWSAWEIEGGDRSRLDVGPVRIWIERIGDEFHYASCRFADGDGALRAEPGEKPGNTEWNRWICGGKPLKCRVKPLLPPRPLIVRPFMPVQVIPGEAVEFFVSIPVWLGICILPEGQEAGERMLVEEPTVTLSNSWFGLPVDGELCYALKTRARRRLEDLRPDSHLAVCPLTIRNQADRMLTFERLCLRVQHLGVYEGMSHLWTNHGTMLYRGEDAMTGIVFDSGPPARDGAGRLLAPPREAIRHGAMQRAIGTFKTLATFLE